MDLNLCKVKTTAPTLLVTWSRLKVTLTHDPKAVPALDSPEVVSHKATTDHILQARWSAAKGWEDPQIVPAGSFSLGPSASAYRGYDGNLRLFRPDPNCVRMLNSATRVTLPGFHPKELKQLVHRICAVDGPKWFPRDQAGQSLCIRPTLIGTGEGLCLHAPREGLLYIILTTEDMVRAWPGGMGHVKDTAVKSGFDQVLWLFGPDHQVTEAGAFNFFVVWRTAEGNLQLITAPLEDQLILPGVTRRSILELARDPLEVVEKRFSIHDIGMTAEQGRLLGALIVGTAYFIAPVSCIAHGGHEIDVPVDAVPYASVFWQLMSDIVYGKKQSEWTEVVEEE
ncbi:branched-chain amino acid aminotransferase II [Aspergillus homomorphus CBS 101889]|uniref:Branched-chain-amino-acid aminotransferase n=1 Tax=Aspergillus homomorphus (strain CBS 101889) TaxID=1450537 RepID=A0A395HG58_ASPHC|nr:branched-chain amino acid aminotransferase II [Aspergillus homomorphus CBS 101889]RAL06730.1 branched-chain amino acid aminotransferase II [Aspergillus homomorphus CBS 101889]